MGKYIYLERITRADDTTINEMAGRECMEVIKDDTLGIKEYRLAKEDMDNGYGCSNLIYGKFGRIIYMRDTHPDMGRIKRENNLPMDMPVFGSNWTKTHARFVGMDEKSNQIPGTEVLIPLDKYYGEGYEISPAIPVVIWHCETKYLQPDLLWNRLNIAFMDSGIKFYPDSKWRNMAVNDELYRIIKRHYPNAMRDYLDQKHNDNYAWIVEMYQWE